RGRSAPRPRAAHRPLPRRAASCLHVSIRTSHLLSSRFTFPASAWIKLTRRMALLEIRNVTRRFGGIVAIDDVSLDVQAGQIVGLIGPNGAGKTTLFNVITRLYKPDSGSLVFAGKSLLRTPPHRVV